MANGLLRGIDPSFFRHLVLRQVRQDYLDNITGFAWLVLQPLLLLAVYAFVFTTIFQARIPDSGDVSFVAFLAVAFWPWTAFSEAILKASGTIVSNAALVSKVSFATEQLPLATVTATFLMHGIGYLAVLVVLQLLGTPLHWLMLPFVVFLYVLLWLLAGALALVASSLQVFVRDVAQMLPPLMTFWFFTTPILYSQRMLPEGLAAVMAWNPMTWFVEHLRGALLHGRLDVGAVDLVAPLVVMLLFLLGLAWFRKFSGHFEDFL
jgi:ABC-type polysaccharide/polyol phosphate export permease